jgi:hypothetical protein
LTDLQLGALLAASAFLLALVLLGIIAAVAVWLFASRYTEAHLVRTKSGGVQVVAEFSKNKERKTT